MLLVQSFVFQAHQCLPSHVVVQLLDAGQLLGQRRMLHRYLANRAQGEAEGDSRSHPTLHQHVSAAVQVEHMAALQLDSRCAGESFGEADHAHIVGVLFQIGAR